MAQNIMDAIICRQSYRFIEISPPPRVFVFC